MNPPRAVLPDRLPSMTTFETRATDLLRQLTGSPRASFRDDQLDAIRALVVDRKRALVVQRTGWGKSAVYFIATRLLRDEGSGPTLIVSPLLALIRNQIPAAARMGVRAEQVTSENTAEWPHVIERIHGNEVDLLLVSPERLANRRFADEVLGELGNQTGLVVIDEAHCISDWGHDFRPDYRRIQRVLEVLPAGVPVLACTATANDRVVDDVVAQLGTGIEVFRGPLSRDGLALQVVALEAPAARLAWLARVVPTLPGSGIVYCLTVRDTAIVAEWLQGEGIDALAYSGDSDGRPEMEQALLNNQTKVLVATSALGMGFDKPDLAFVIHYQSPGSVIHYYQQVGRAGRQLASSHGILLRGREDRDIQDWFIRTAFPSEDEALAVVRALERHDGFVKLTALEAEVNIGRQRLEGILKNLEVDRFIVSDGQKYQRTPVPYAPNQARSVSITALRRAEQDQMDQYGTLNAGCRMAFLGEALDDADVEPCGICDLCTDQPISAAFDTSVAARAADYLRKRPVRIEPRKQWAGGTKIPTDERVEEGRALCRWADGGWSELVRKGKQDDRRFDASLADALAQLVRDWAPTVQPTWICWVPSTNNPALVAQLAEQLGAHLKLPVVEAIRKTRATRPQKKMQNSSQQLANIKDAFVVAGPLPSGPVLLVDDLVDSRWTFTYLGSLLRGAGVPAVLPLALADSGSS